MSEQHIFPDRLRRVLPRVHGTRQLGAWDHIRRGNKIRDRVETVKHNQGSIAASRIRRVCKTCNNGWLREMEQECFPLIERLIIEPNTVLQPPDQTKIARVATSMAMVGEWLYPEHITTSQEEREEFREKLAPPKGWFVFIGRTIFRDRVQFLSDGCVIAEKVHADAPKQYLSFTMIVGPVVIHVLTLDPSTILDADMYAEHNALASICPPTDWINFGLMPALNAADITSVRAYAGMSLRKYIESK
jgi:hypothetical protein